MRSAALTCSWSQVSLVCAWDQVRIGEFGLRGLPAHGGHGTASTPAASLRARTAELFLVEVR